MVNHPVYVRMTTENEMTLFRNRSATEAIIGVVIEAQKQEWMQLHGFVVLPEALEMVATPIKQGVSGLVAHIQAETIPLLAILLPNANAIWERRFMQIPLNTQRALDARLAMLLLAPVAAGIVDMAASYPYSSANARYAANVSVFTDFSKRSTAEIARVAVAEAPKPPDSSVA
jgi:putative transposase